MRGLLLTAVFIGSYLGLQAQGVTYWSPEQCMKLKNITSVRVSPDGSKVLYTVRQAMMTEDRSEYVNQIYLANIDGSNTIPLTQGDKNNSSPKWSPDGSQVAFLSNRDGKNNLYIISLRGGDADKITDVKTGVGNFSWSPDGKMIAFIMTDAPADNDDKKKKAKDDWYYYDDVILQNRLYLVWPGETDSAGKKRSKQLTMENRNVISFDWSPDSRWIVYSHAKTPMANDAQYADISEINISTKETKTIAGTPAGESDPLFSPDGKYIAYVCSENPVVWPGKTFIDVVPAEGGAVKKLSATPNDQPALLSWSQDGSHIYVAESNKTLTSIYQLGLDGNEISEWTKGCNDLAGTFSMNETRTFLGFVLQNTSTPGEAYITRVSTFTPVKISNINADIAHNPVPKTELIKWKSVDGKEIEALLTYPLNYTPGKKYPLILNPHGGPAGGYTQSFIATNQNSYPIASLAEKGMFVLRPNPRGSTGYGVAFREANQRDWGGADFKDLMAGVDYVIKLGVADPERLGVMGWSYGGFMTSWIVGHTDRFKAASIGAPVVDLSFQNLTDDINGFLPSYMKADPWADWAVYDEHSPLRFVQNVKTPVMLQHGEADARVPISNSLMFYHALQRRGVPVRLLALPRQPHGPTEPKMVFKVSQSNLDWFENYLVENKKAF
ncbi:MAG TPA: S9 family peptidase [Puia sp.]|nr:S9 family peptidase [Puia sp.]